MMAIIVVSVMAMKTNVYAQEGHVIEVVNEYMTSESQDEYTEEYNDFSKQDLSNAEYIQEMENVESDLEMNTMEDLTVKEVYDDDQLENSITEEIQSDAEVQYSEIVEESQSEEEREDAINEEQNYFIDSYEIETIDLEEEASNIVNNENWQSFEGNFKSKSDVITYSFSVDFKTVDSVAVCLVRTGYVGANIKVYDEAGNLVLNRSTQGRQAKNWGFLNQPSDTSGICNYKVEVVPKNYEERLSSFRIIVGKKDDAEIMMSGIENTVLLEKYYESKINLQNENYLPNRGEYWFKFTGDKTDVITILNNSDNIRFKIKDATNLNEIYDSGNDISAHKTAFLGNGSWTSAEKIHMDSVLGNNSVSKEYYLILYNISPDNTTELKSGLLATAVGNPVMCRDTITVKPGKSVTATKSSYTSIKYTISDASIPSTAQVKSIYLRGPRMSSMGGWKVKAPNSSLWINSISATYPQIDLNFVKDATTNTKLKGTWSFSFKASSSKITFKPYFDITYYYEYGD